MRRTFSFTAKIWVYPGKVAWSFVSVPAETTTEIDFYFAHEKRGWGSLPVHATLGQSTWDTSIFPDRKTKTYLLPIKAAIRTAEGVKEGDSITIFLQISV